WKLETKMEELKKHFNLTDRDLNINLAPLDNLL
ncbi:MAG: gas vesicle protein K, partial [Bacteroidales bacterium]|nr:gas vesicle protein K [Bacteroidales bacterium]